MAPTALLDIDELALACRAGRARTLISEAIVCYKAGAYRSCVVATWIAVMYDVIGKLEELEAAGCAPATPLLDLLRNQDHLSDIERIQASQRFEREVLDQLKGADFELISDQEFIDLNRIREDRHRCAHPAMAAGFEPYVMSAELARTHLRNAVMALLQHPPAQGNFAKGRIFGAIASDLFPQGADEAAESLRHGDLARARPRLVKTVVMGLTTSLLREDLPEQERARQFAALGGTGILHAAETQRVLSENFNRLVSLLPDDRLPRAVQFVGTIEGTWDFLDAEQKRRMGALLAQEEHTLPTRILISAAKIPDLWQQIVPRLGNLIFPVFGALVHEVDAPELAEEAVRRFASSGSFAEAATNATQIVLPLAGKLNSRQLSLMLRAFADNAQINGSWGTPETLVEVIDHADNGAKAGIDRAAVTHTIDRIDQFLAAMYSPAMTSLRAALQGLP